MAEIRAITEDELESSGVREITEDDLQGGGGLQSQFLAGINDVTGLLARPFEKAFGTIEFGPEGPRFLSPDETTQLLEEKGRVGIPGQATTEPTGMFGRGMRTAGQTAAAAPIMGTAARAVGAPVGSGIAAKAKGFIHEMGRGFAAAPALSTAAETGLGFTAGASGYVAGEIFPDSDLAVFIGEMLGGIGPALTPTNATIQVTRSLYNKARHPFTMRGGAKRAQARAQRAGTTEERLQALQELGKETTIDPATGRPVLSPAQRSGSEGLMSLEKAIVESSEELLHESHAQIARANQIIQGSLLDLGDAAPIAATIPISEKQNYLKYLMDTRVQVAAAKAEDRIAQLGPKVGREQANRIAREELEGALEAARRQESELFDVIPEDTAVPFEATESAFRRLFKRLGRPQQKDMPDAAKKFLSEDSGDYFGAGDNRPPGFREGETRIKDLRALQSELRQEARNARAGEVRNLNKARLADSIANSINDDLANAAAGPEVSEAIAVAVDFSRNLNDRFSRGTVSRLLGRRASGGEQVPDSLTLEESIGVYGPKAREGFDDLLKAFDSPEAPSSAVMVGASQEYLRSKFLKAAMDRGQFNVRSAQRFLDQNEALLSRLPKLRAQMEEAITFSDASTFTQKQASRITLDDPRVSKATMLIERGPVETFRQISRMKPKDAGQEAQKLVNRVLRDETGEAHAGLKAGFIEFLLQGAKSGQRDVAGRPFVSGFALRDALKVPATRAAANRVFSEDELLRIGVITRDLIKLENRLASKMPVEGVIGDTPSKVVEAVAGITGAAVGRSQARNLGVGGTVQIPGIMATRFRELANKGVSDPASRLLRDSVGDEDLFKDLLMAKLDKAGNLPRKAVRRLNAWTAVVVAEHGGVFEEEDVPEVLF